MPHPAFAHTTTPAEWHLPALSDVRRHLEQQRQFRIEQLEWLAGEPDRPTAAHREVTQALRRAAERVLADIEAALTRLDLGRYGVCDFCGEPIQPERLEAVPMSRYCSLCEAQRRARRPRRYP